MRRRAFFGLAGAATAWPFATLAQKLQGTPIIGWLGSTTVQPEHVNPFLQGLKQEGFVENENVKINYRWADGAYDRLPGFAAEFAKQPVDLIAAITTRSALAAKTATNSIPTVFLSGADPIQMGLVTSLNRPGGNRTGVTLVTHALDAKRLEALRELVPTIKKVGAILNPNSASAETNKADVVAAARALNLQIVIVNVGGAGDLDSAFAELSVQKIDGLLVGADSLLHSLNHSIVRLVERHRFPAVYEWREHTHVGGLLSYGTDISAILRQAGAYGGRILKGVRPSELPVLEPTKFELAINLKTAKALGITVPGTLLARADEVIE